MDLQLRDVVVVVTGGASGIGQACARAFRQEGALVAVWDLAPGADYIVDVSDFEAVQDATAASEAALGPIAHVVHSAAIGSGKFGFPFTNLTPADWKRVLEVNILGTVHIAHAIAPGMIARRFGTITLLGSIAGQIGSQTDPPYSASKAANFNFAQCLAKDLAPHNIRVNTVNPGMVKTPLSQRIWQAWGIEQTPETMLSFEAWFAQKVAAAAPLGRPQTPEDIANMVVFLASGRACQITGQILNVDGGQVMGR